MYVLTSGQMRAADEYTINALGVPSLALMERAGRALAKEAEALCPYGKVLCVCGGGNNGGDGFVCARVLKNGGREVDCLLVGERLSRECERNLREWQEAGGAVLNGFPEEKYALIIDCLLGTGFHGALEGEYLRAVEQINASGARVLSADVPSGVNGDNGEVNGVAVQADVTLCIGEKKAGCFLGAGIDFAGEVKRADIGIVLPEKGYAVLSDDSSARAALPKRRRYSNKGSYGRAAIVAGSEEYTGAAYLSAAACLRAGAGYTTLFLPEKILPYYVLKAPEILLKPLNGGGRVAFSEESFAKLLSYDAVAYGMGTGVSEDVAKGAVYLLKHYAGKLILDADALNSLTAFCAEDFKEIFGAKKCDVVLTPHIKEFSRLSGESVQTLINKGLSAPAAFAKTHKITVLLKSAVSILSDGERTVLNVSGNSGQAKGGSGDVLAGVLAGLCAMGASAFDGARGAAHLVGRAAELAAEDLGEYSLTATDLISYLPRAFLRITEDANEQGGKE